MSAPNGKPKTIKEYLLSTRMAKYPMLSVAIAVALLALLWHFDPEFVRWLREAIKNP